MLMCVFLLGTCLGDSTTTKERTITKVADGIYVIRHPDAPDTFPQGNTTVIIGDRGVLVVDSCYLPSSAREDIAQIRQWTNRPVRYLVNTHWHNDHVQGNSAYREAFPQIDIVSHNETRKHIAGYVSKYPNRFAKIRAIYQQMIDSGKDRDGNPISTTQLAEVKTALAGKAVVEQELNKNVILPPTLSFDGEFNVDLGNREVEVRYLGRGNTSGDVVVYIPKEKIVAVGDLLDHPVPYLGGGYPSEEAATLKRLAMLDANTIVTGHGDVLHDKVFLNDVIAFIETVVKEVSNQTYIAGNGPRNLDEVRKNVLANIDVAAWKKKLGGTSQEDQDFFERFSLGGIVTAAYAETWGR
jgi:glyoxylase-like metal-dependent hydrolase (beta-lactamase superfamily II)